jgi:cytochrome P450
LEDSGVEDVLGALLAAADEDGSRLTDTEIRDQVISLIAAGYETTSAAMAWAVYSLLSTPGEWDTLHQRLDEPQAPYLDAVVSETLRLYPPAVVSARWSVRDFSYDGVRVPARSYVLYSPYVTHRLPELWPDPDRFEPRRWLPDDPRYRKPGPHEYLPFGGGPHRCIGAGFATTELRTLLEQLVRRTRLELVHPERVPHATNLAAMRPRDGLLVRVTGAR